jgi:hypothetical protein
MSQSPQSKSSPVGFPDWPLAGGVLTAITVAIVVAAGPARASAPLPVSAAAAESAIASPQAGAPEIAPRRPLTARDVVLRPLNGYAGGDIYPEGAQRRRVTGSADIVCGVSAEQRLTACEVTSEKPQGMGFGAAASRLYSHFGVDPMAKDGSATAGRLIDLHMEFKIGK